MRSRSDKDFWWLSTTSSRMRAAVLMEGLGRGSGSAPHYGAFSAPRLRYTRKEISAFVVVVILMIKVQTKCSECCGLSVYIFQQSSISDMISALLNLSLVFFQCKAHVSLPFLFLHYLTTSSPPHYSTVTRCFASAQTSTAHWPRQLPTCFLSPPPTPKRNS